MLELVVVIVDVCEEVDFLVEVDFCKDFGVEGLFVLEVELYVEIVIVEEKVEILVFFIFEYVLC